MTPLRRRMIEDMRLRNFSASTERSYLHYVAGFARHFNTSPEYLGLDDIRNYQLYLTEQRQLSAQSVNTFVSAVQFLYTVTLEMPWGNNRFVRMRVPEKLPVVLSREEVTALFGFIGILKHRAVLMLCYGSGLRISEAVSLKAAHIDSSRMLIRIEKGKGAKDRYTVLSQTLLELLRRYWKIQRPKDYLFPGSQSGTHVHESRRGGEPGRIVKPDREQRQDVNQRYRDRNGLTNPEGVPLAVAVAADQTFQDPSGTPYATDKQQRKQQLSSVLSVYTEQLYSKNGKRSVRSNKFNPVFHRRFAPASGSPMCGFYRFEAALLFTLHGIGWHIGSV